MQLYLDLGNSYLKWAVMTQAAQVHEQGQLRLADFLQQKHGAPLPWQIPVRTALLSSVLGNFWTAKAVDILTQNNIEVQRILVSPTFTHKLQTAYEDPFQLGIDRWLALFGALGRGSCWVIDMGTATTIDRLHKTEKGSVHKGGWIMPSAHLMHNALTTQTHLPNIESQRFSVTLGNDTASCINRGVDFILYATIQQLYQQQPLPIILCGGGAPSTLPSLLNIEIHHDPALVFKGMAFWQSHFNKK